MKATEQFKVTPAQIREAWQQIQDGQNPVPGQHALRSYVTGMWRGSTVDNWIGCSGEQMNGWIQNGYYVDNDLSVSIGQGTDEIFTRQILFDEEEGDLQIEQILNGEDLYRAVWEDDVAVKGITIRACFDFNAGTPATVLHAYFAWILKLIDTAERQGITPTVELFIRTRGSYTQKPNAVQQINIPVVNAGELVDTVAWRAFLHGGGFRTLGFLALGIVGEQNGWTLTTGLGQAVGQKWDVTFDGDVLTIDCPGNTSKFPEDEMTAKAEAAFSSL